MHDDVFVLERVRALSRTGVDVLQLPSFAPRRPGRLDENTMLSASRFLGRTGKARFGVCAVKVGGRSARVLEKVANEKGSGQKMGMQATVLDSKKKKKEEETLRHDT